MKITKTLNEFEDAVGQLTMEYIREDGYITVEFATTGDFIKEKNEYLKKINMERMVDWHMYICDCCTEQNGNNGPIHCEIV